MRQRRNEACGRSSEGREAYAPLLSSPFYGEARPSAPERLANALSKSRPRRATLGIATSYLMLKSMALRQRGGDGRLETESENKAKVYEERKEKFRFVTAQTGNARE